MMPACHQHRGPWPARLLPKWQEELPKTMQSSTTVALRAIIMLGCLVLIPLIALFGSSAPELVARFLDARLGRSTAPVSVSKHGVSDAPEFQSKTEPPLLASGPESVADPGVIPANAVTPSGAETPAGRNLPAVSVTPKVSTTGTSAPGMSGPAIPGSGGLPLAALPPVVDPVPLNASPLDQDGLQPIPRQGQTPATVGLSAGLPAQGAQPNPNGIPPLGPGATPTQPTGSPTGVISPPSASEGGTFVLIQERLRDLGAVYYRLESWGSQQQLFRFQCEMAVQGSPGLTRHFEAVDGHPLLAMHKVLAEAESWQASR